MARRECGIMLPAMNDSQFQEEVHEVDFCVVGGGIAGMFAAISPSLTV